MYNKLFTKILDSSIWLEPSPTRIVWLTLIAAMDQTGFAQFASPANLANRAIVTLEEAQNAIRCLESEDPESSNPKNGGRRIERVPGGWMVLNSEEHRNLITAAIIREQTRLRVQRHRDMKRTSNAPVTDGNGSSNATVTPSEAVSEANQVQDVRTDVQPSPVIPQRTSAPLKPQTIIQPRRKDAAWEGPRFYVPQRMHRDLVGLRHGAETELLGWYEEVSNEWTQGIRKAEEPGSDMFVFWRNRYSEKWPATAAMKSSNGAGGRTGAPPKGKYDGITES